MSDKFILTEIPSTKREEPGTSNGKDVCSSHNQGSNHERNVSVPKFVNSKSLLVYEVARFVSKHKYSIIGKEFVRN